MPIAYPGTENKAWWVLEAANLLYLHSEFPSLSFVPIKLSPGVGTGGGSAVSHRPGVESQGKDVLCFAAIRDSGQYLGHWAMPQHKQSTQRELLAKQLKNSSSSHVLVINYCGKVTFHCIPK